MLNILNFDKDNSLIDSKTLIQLLDEIMNPVALRLGLERKDKYLWYKSVNSEIRTGLEYSFLKGGQGTLTWGVALGYIPIITGNNLTFHKTGKRVKLHLFEWTNEYSNSFCGGKMTNGVASHWGVKNARASISDLLKRNEDKIQLWLEMASKHEKLIEIAEEQITIGRQYNIHHPNPKFVLPFLYAHSKLSEKAIAYFESLNSTLFNNDDEIRLKVKMRLLKLIQQ